MMVLRTKRQISGFTLVELLVVLAILGMLAALVGPQVLNQLGGAKSKSATIQIRDLEQALELYKLDVGRFPDSLESLVRAPNGARGWNGPYLKKDEVPLDPWGNAYDYRFPVSNGAGYEIVSFGADGREGGQGEAADVSS